MRLNSLVTLSAIVLTLSGCGGGGGSTSTDPIILEDIDVNVTIIDDYQVESLGTAKTINANVSLGNTAKDLYLVLSNSANVSGSTNITHNAKVAPVAQAKTILSTELIEKPAILHAPQHVQDFPSRIGTVLTQDQTIGSHEKTVTTIERHEDAIYTEQIFYLSENTSESTPATARYVSTINTVFGDKTLNIWVSNDSFDKEDGSNDCNKSKCVTQSMVNELAKTFLLSGSDNDIYDWVTNIFGEEWGSDAEAKDSSLIGKNDEITILLTDIDKDDSSNGGVIGFFYAKDNYINGIYNNGTYDLRGSNERVMFYIDSVIFANEDGVSWDINDSWPKETVSTLAHEFQHMIDFYQKNVLLDANADTWIKEMLSESTEDIIATKIGHNVETRYPLFNKYNFFSLTEWYKAKNNSYEEGQKELSNYSRVNAFGGYLLRNYGGAKLLNEIMHNSEEDEDAIVSAVGLGKTFADLLSEWGTAVMLSDHDNLVDVPIYNKDTLFESVYGSIIYEMRSINFFNYDPLPTIYVISGTVQPQGNYYYLIGEDLTGDINISLELNGQTEAILIAKQK